MKLRAVVGLVAVAVLVGVGTAIGSVHQRALSTVGSAQVHSGAWYCPHGGGPGWRVDLSVTNPGPQRVSIRVSRFARRSSATGAMLSVAPGSVVHVPVKAARRGSSGRDRG